ncbi:hypothetical protein [Xanthocytophaga flava]|uniref:hypothetical protein n=1 Tax=Xanthocytophaga flava TaxID=3048013 RepID=UPI0028D8022B|nr:hypothetical protein [Xanthocytophaga flavus]MDJ1468421.1 hypothetical protein [Xanthocytophaga flavus]
MQKIVVSQRLVVTFGIVVLQNEATSLYKCPFSLPIVDQNNNSIFAKSLINSNTSNNETKSFRNGFLKQEAFQLPV